jgi:hypothetical protein
MTRHFPLLTSAIKRIAPLALGTLLATVAAAPREVSAADGRARLRTYNTYGNRSIWVTIYDLGKTRHLDYGCVAPNSDRWWESESYAYGSFYYIRAEVKEDSACGGKTLCDTTVQVNPQYPGYILPEGVGGPSGGTVWLAPNGNNCYWAKSAPATPPASNSPSPSPAAGPMCNTKWGPDLTEAAFKAGKPIADPAQEFTRYMRVPANRAWWCKQNKKLDCSSKARTSPDYCTCFNGC